MSFPIGAIKMLLLSFMARSYIDEPRAASPCACTACSCHCPSAARSKGKRIAAVKPRKSCITNCSVATSCSHETQLLYSVLGDCCGLQKTRWKKKPPVCRVTGRSAALCNGWKDLTAFSGTGIKLILTKRSISTLFPIRE